MDNTALVVNFFWVECQSVCPIVQDKQAYLIVSESIADYICENLTRIRHTSVMCRQIDWQEFDEVISGRGICNHERLAAKRKAWEEGAWVREAALAHAEKQRARQAA